MYNQQSSLASYRLLVILACCICLFVASATTLVGASPTAKHSVTTSSIPVAYLAKHKPKHPTKQKGVNGNPYGYNFSPGRTISNPPSGFCGFFNCIPTFVEPDDPGDGYVVQCGDGKYSQSGGERGACSRHGGVSRPLYSH